MTGRVLRDALDAQLAGYDGRALTTAVQQLSDSYRSGRTPLLDTELAVAAYAAYRMPATHAAVSAVLAQLPPMTATSLVDLGGGTGAAAWAVAAATPDLDHITVVDRSAQALAFGRQLAQHAPYDALRGARWQQGDLTAPPEAELVVASYLLGELTDAQARSLIDAVRRRGTVLLVEPGTPAGYRRILTARDQLIAEGQHVVAPCPHDARCPLADTTDWCHLAARLERSALHRRVKGGELGYEDEKFAYVVTAEDTAPAARGRVLRHPQKRKGLVGLTVCGQDGRVHDTKVGRSRPDYRAARDTRWGDPWPPDG